MTRFSIALVAVSAFAICACERHPFLSDPKDSMITHTHGSNGAPGEHHEEKSEGKKEEEKKTGEGAAKAEEAKAEPKKAGSEEKPEFFSEGE